MTGFRLASAGICEAINVVPRSTVPESNISAHGISHAWRCFSNENILFSRGKNGAFCAGMAAERTTRAVASKMLEPTSRCNRGKSFCAELFG